MRIIERKHGISGHPSAMVQATFEQMKSVSADPSNFDTRSTEQSLYTFAKCYYRGGGWWFIAGYDCDGADVSRVLDQLNANIT